MVPSFPIESEARHDEGFLNSADHLRLFWQKYTPPGAKATVLVVHGAADHSGRYPFLTSALVRAGFQVALLDLRGHGQSDGKRWYVDAFTDYLRDLDAFVAKLSQDGIAGEQLFVVAHSAGALVAVLWELAHDGLVSGLVLSSPYLKLAARPPVLKVLAARLAGRFVPALPVSPGFGSDVLTSDLELQRWTDRDPLYGRATTPRWFEESMRAQQEAVRRAPEVRVPLLVVAAGADGLADVGASRAFVDAAGSADKRLVVYEGFRHEIFNEVRRQEPIGEVVGWLSAHAR